MVVVAAVVPLACSTLTRYFSAPGNGCHFRVGTATVEPFSGAICSTEPGS